MAQQVRLAGVDRFAHAWNRDVIGNKRRPEKFRTITSLVGKIDMNGIIYIIGLVVVIAAVLSFFGLR